MKPRESEALHGQALARNLETHYVNTKDARRNEFDEARGLNWLQQFFVSGVPGADTYNQLLMSFNDEQRERFYNHQKKMYTESQRMRPPTSDAVGGTGFMKKSRRDEMFITSLASRQEVLNKARASHIAEHNLKVRKSNEFPLEQGSPKAMKSQGEYTTDPFQVSVNVSDIATNRTRKALFTYEQQRLASQKRQQSIGPNNAYFL